MRKSYLAVVAAAAALSVGTAFGADPSTQDLQKQLDQLQQQVAQLQAQQKATDQATIAAVQADSAKRSTFSLSDAVPFANNYDDGKFILRSDDGAFSLHPWFQAQFRDGTTYRERVSATDSDHDIQNGFEYRRMKFGVDGNVFGKNNTYYIDWNTDRTTGNLVLEEAWFRARLGDEGPLSDWAIKFGQFKDPLAHESLVSSKKDLVSELSLLTDLFVGGSNYVQGATLSYSHDAIQVEGGITDGINSINNNFQDFPTNAWDYGVVARVNYKVFGDWSAYDQFTSLNDKNDLLVIGAAVDYSEGGNTDQVVHTVDAQYNIANGLGLYGAYYGRYTKDAPKGVTAVATDDTYDWGFIAQASYVIPDTKWEPFARYDYINFDDGSVAAGARNTVHEITAGANYYFHSHAAKFTLDVSYLPNGSPIADTSTDTLASPNTEIIVRAQFQLLL